MTQPGQEAAPDALGDDDTHVMADAEQSPEQRLEAAEFLVATRVQEQIRRRVARAAMDVRDRKRDELTEAIHQPPAD